MDFPGTGPFFDTHAHLPLMPGDAWKSYCDVQVLVPGVALEDHSGWRRRCPAARFALGLHPAWIERSEHPDWYRARSLLATGRFAALGETGLDSRLSISHSTQMRILEAHFELAQEFDLPLILHLVGDLSPIDELMRDYPYVRAVLHGFAARRLPAPWLLESGRIWLGVGAHIPANARAWKILADVRLGQLLLETDADRHKPGGLPVLRRGLERLAAHRQEPLEYLQQILYANACDLFGASNTTDEGDR